MILAQSCCSDNPELLRRITLGDNTGLSHLPQSYNYGNSQNVKYLEYSYNDISIYSRMSELSQYVNPTAKRIFSLLRDTQHFILDVLF